MEEINSEIKRNADYIMKKVIGNEAEVDYIENWGIGALNSCYMIVLKNSTKKFFLKIENDNIIPSTRRGQIEREVKGIELMNSIGVPCPVIVHSDCSKVDIGKKYILQEFINDELLWVIKDTLTVEENDYIKVQITDILNKMKSIEYNYFGDTYENGVIGQYPTWKEAYSAMWKLLQEDAVMLNLFNPEELDIVIKTGEYALAHIFTLLPASFYHGDLGKHNVLVKSLDGRQSISTVIDFGNSSFTPSYMNDDLTRKYGDWGLEVIDICDKYSISQLEYTTNNLIFEFENTIFISMLELSAGKDTRDIKERFLGSCRQIWNNRL